MDYKAGGLIHDNYFRVFVEDVERDILGGQLRWRLRGWDVNVHFHGFGNLGMRPHLLAADCDTARFDQ
jgi:hypothetical protein